MKKTVITCITVFICVIAICVTSTIGIGKIGDAKVEIAKNSGTAGAYVENTGSTDDTGVPVETPDTPDETPIDESTSGTDGEPAADDGTSAPAGETANTKAPSKGTAASSKPTTTSGILTYFNNSINNIKPNAKSLLKNYEKNSQAGSFQLTGALKSLSGTVDKLVQSNMGEKKEDHNKSLTTKADIKKYLPVENESWSSKLTTSNITSATLAEKSGKYVITIKVKEDAPASSCSHGAGNHGKAFSIVMPQTILDNAGSFESMMKDLKVGYKNGKIVATVDPATGNITHINYYFVWSLTVTVLGMTVSAPFGIEQDFEVKW